MIWQISTAVLFAILVTDDMAGFDRFAVLVTDDMAGFDRFAVCDSCD